MELKKLVDYAEKVYWTPNNLVYTPSENEKLWKDYAQHEGIVIKSFEYNKEKRIGFSFKVKNLAYAEKGLGEIHKFAESYNK